MALWASQVALVVKNPPANAGDALEEGMAKNCSILAWKIRWTEEPGGPQSIELQSWTQLSTHTVKGLPASETGTGDG